ncbi:hypothetical protein D9M73_275150 [compost metagenome]
MATGFRALRMDQIVAPMTRQNISVIGTIIESNISCSRAPYMKPFGSFRIASSTRTVVPARLKVCPPATLNGLPG